MSTEAGNIAGLGNRVDVRRRLAEERPGPTDRKEQWVQRHADQILRLWRRWQTPLGVAPDYARQLEKDLAEFYEQPLIRTFIESTY
jgi:hypothetical protein